MASEQQDDIEKAFRIWFRKYNFKDLESDIFPFLKKEIKGYPEQTSDWIRRVRLGLFLSSESIAKKLNVTRQAFAEYERSELKGTISLATLAKVADAMDCELVYAIRPKNRNSFSFGLWLKLYEVAKNHFWLNSYRQLERPKAYVAVANRLMQSPEFKKKHGWSQRLNAKLAD
jgi:transcriptional regulator with XRE-family HTH domain